MKGKKFQTKKQNISNNNSNNYRKSNNNVKPSVNVLKFDFNNNQINNSNFNNNNFQNKNQIKKFET